MTVVRNNSPQVRRAAPGRARGRAVAVPALALGLAAALTGCATAKQVWHDNVPILGDPTAGQGGGKDAPNAKLPYPKLGTVPSRPASSETADDRRMIAKDLVSARDSSETILPSVDAENTPAARALAAKAASTPEKKVTSAVPAEATPGAVAAPAPVQVAQAATPTSTPKRPGVWERFFGHKTKAPPQTPNTPEPLPAQPTTPVTIKPADPALPRS